MYRVLGFRAFRFRGLGPSDLGFRVQGFRACRFRVLGPSGFGFRAFRFRGLGLRLSGCLGSRGPGFLNPETQHTLTLRPEALNLNPPGPCARRTRANREVYPKTRMGSSLN